MYYIYLGKDVLLPVAPESLKMKIGGKNKTMTLINDGEINLLKNAGLTDISFEVMLPQIQQYPFAIYKNGFKTASYFLEKFEKLKNSLEPFQFIISRITPDGKNLYSTDIKVSLEDYTITTKAKNGLDEYVSINLKQYREYSTKTVAITIKQARPKPVAVVVSTRPAPTAPTTRSYTVVRGDCLWNIAKKYYGNGNKYTTIYNANRDKIKNPNLIYPRTSSYNTVGGCEMAVLMKNLQIIIQHGNKAYEAIVEERC